MYIIYCIHYVYIFSIIFDKSHCLINTNLEFFSLLKAELISILNDYLINEHFIFSYYYIRIYYIKVVRN